MKKLSLTTLFISLLLITPCLAEDWMDWTPTGLSLSSTVSTSHILPSGYCGNEGLGTEQSATVTFSNDSYLNIWTYNSLTADKTTNEIDFTAGFEKHLYNGINFGTQIAYWRNYGTKGADMLVPAAWLNHNMKIANNTVLNTRLEVATPFPARHSSPEEGVYIYLGAWTTAQANEKLSITQGPELVWNSGVYNAEPGIVGNYRVGANYKLTKSLSLTAQLQGFLGIQDAEDCNNFRCNAKMGISINF